MSKSQYPRGTPYKPPEGDNPGDIALARDAQLRRWMIQVALGTIIVVVLIVGTGVFFVQRAMGRSGAPAAGDTTPGESKPRETKPSVVVAPAQPPLPPPAPVGDPPPTPRERALEAIGGLSAAHLYQSYLNIGMLADAAENEVYSTDDAKKLLSTIVDWMENVDQQFQRLGTTTLEEADQKRVGQVRELTAVLRTEAKELRAYWDTPDSDMDGKKDHEMKFHKSREAAWSGIKELLGIKDE
jgi:hypothetical protein